MSKKYCTECGNILVDCECLFQWEDEDTDLIEEVIPRAQRAATMSYAEAYADASGTEEPDEVPAYVQVTTSHY